MNETKVEESEAIEETEDVESPSEGIGDTLTLDTNEEEDLPPEGTGQEPDLG